MKVVQLEKVGNFKRVDCWFSIWLSQMPHLCGAAFGCLRSFAPLIRLGKMLPRQIVLKNGKVVPELLSFMLIRH